MPTGKPVLERAVDAVGPLAFVRIAVVRVQHRAVVVEEIERALGKRGKRQQQPEPEIS